MISLEEMNNAYGCMMESSKIFHNDLGCILYRNTKDYTKFNTHLHRSNEEIFRLSLDAHRLALLKRYQTLFIPEELESSHICHHRNCVNTAHIRAETHELNKERQTCHKNFIKKGEDCSGHGAEHPRCLMY